MADLSVIVVNWNGGELLARCLAAVPAGAGGLSHEVLVVDNGSRDGSPAMVRERFPDVTLLEPGRNLGFAAANNLAAARACGRYLVLLNPDTEIVGPCLIRNEAVRQPANPVRVSQQFVCAGGIEGCTHASSHQMQTSAKALHEFSGACHAVRQERRQRP